MGAQLAHSLNAIGSDPETQNPPTLRRGPREARGRQEEPSDFSHLHAEQQPEALRALRTHVTHRLPDPSPRDEFGGGGDRARQALTPLRGPCAPAGEGCASADLR